MNYKKSKLKYKLKNGLTSIGSWLTIPSTEIIEIYSKSKFEWLVIDMEHTGISISEAKELIKIIQANEMEALVRVPKNEEVIIKKVLDLGANGIIIPMINNKKDAEKAISFSKYPPDGVRGVGLNRAQGYGFDFEKYKKWHKDNLIIITQIEHKLAVENIESILEVEGIDATLIGPYDLSASMGFPGKYNMPTIKKTLRKLEADISKSKIPLGLHLIEPSSKLLKEKINMGYNLIAFSIDFLFLGEKLDQK